jgi:hypothetical protein
LCRDFGRHFPAPVGEALPERSPSLALFTFGGGHPLRAVLLVGGAASTQPRSPLAGSMRRRPGWEPFYVLHGCQESLHISVVAPVNHLIVLVSKIGTLFAFFELSGGNLKDRTIAWPEN